MADKEERIWIGTTEKKIQFALLIWHQIVYGSVKLATVGKEAIKKQPKRH